jgi:hypothetical protein
MSWSLRMAEIKTGFFTKTKMENGQEVEEAGDPCMIVNFEPLPLTLAQYKDLLEKAKNHVVEVHPR